MSKPKHDSRFQLKAVQGFLASGLNATQYSQQNNLCRSTLCSWARRYQEHGKAAFKVKHSVTTRYTKDFKLSVLKTMQAKNLTQKAATALFNLGGNSTIDRWQKEYVQGGLDALKSKGERVAAKTHPPQKANSKKPSTPEELLLAQKQEEIDYLRAEVAYLKKLDALIRNKKSATKKKR